MPENLKDKTIFPKINFIKAYNRIPINADEIFRTAIMTTFGLHKFSCINYGSRNASQTFTRFICDTQKSQPHAHIYL